MADTLLNLNARTHTAVLILLCIYQLFGAHVFLLLFEIFV